MKIEKRFVIFAIALICGTAAVFLTNYYIKQKIGQKEAQFQAQFKGYLGEAAIVLVASKEIPRGSIIRDNMVGLEKIPSNFAQPNVFSSKEAALGKIASVDIAQGEQILKNKISDKQVSEEAAVGDLAMKTPVGKRAITISIDALSAVGGMVNPGDYVDIIGDFPVAHQIGGKTVTKQMTMTLFQNVLVLAIDGASSSTKGRTSSGKTTVTLALSPQEAALLSYAQQQGIIRLLLRPPLETQTSVLPPVDEAIFWSEMMRKSGITLPEETPSPQVEEKPPLPNVEIYRGSKKEEIPLVK